MSQSPAKIAVADVDHGNDTATATANPSAIDLSLSREKLFLAGSVTIVQLTAMVVAE